MEEQLSEPVQLDGDVEKLEDNNGGLRGLSNDAFTNTPYSVGIQISTLKGESTVDRVITLAPTSKNQTFSRFVEFSGSLPLPEEWDVSGAEIETISQELLGLENFENRFVCYLRDSWRFKYKLDVQRDQEGIMPPTTRLTCIVVRPWVQNWVKVWKYLL